MGPRDGTGDAAAIEQAAIGSIAAAGAVHAVAAIGAEPARSPVARIVTDAPLAVVLFATLVVLNVLDLVSTQMVLDRGGEEGNPIMAPVVHNMAAAAAIKGACLFAIWSLLCRSRRSRRMLAVVAAVDAWYVFVIVWNIKVLLQLT